MVFHGSSCPSSKGERTAALMHPEEEDQEFLVCSEDTADVGMGERMDRGGLPGG